MEQDIKLNQEGDIVFLDDGDFILTSSEEELLLQEIREEIRIPIASLFYSLETGTSIFLYLKSYGLDSQRLIENDITRVMKKQGLDFEMKKVKDCYKINLLKKGISFDLKI